MPPPHTKPENILKRAQELIGVGQQQAAFSILHEHVTSKRTRNNPIASLEPVMLQFVELGVDLRKGKALKDGLYSYKNTAQNTNVGTIELILRTFIERSDQKVTEAQSKAEEVQASLGTSTTSTNVDDLEAIETPESILLSTVSSEQSRDRTDRAIVTPWLKFLWETYRTVLDILKNNARLETLYQSTAHQAFQFCSKYTRKTEFRRLCELLRNHLQNAAKYQSQIHAINLSDPDTLQRHLDTRFQQLNVAVELELWQEAFRSIEDIHTLLNLSKRPAKPVMMANYFDKLSTIFLVSENYLFHAAAYNRYFNLLRGSAAAVASGQSQKKDNPTVTDADLSKCASFVVLSALSIPVISTSRSRGALVDVDETRKNKNQRLTSLLALTSPPSRASIFKDVLSKGLLKRAKPEIRDLYNILEVDFHPLSICRKISPILSQIGSDPEMGKYVAPLQQVILTRLFQQLSQVYESVDLSFVLNLAQFPEPFQVGSGTIEKFIMNGCKKGDLAIRIDHASGTLTFDSDVFSSAKALHPGSGAGSAETESSTVQRLQNTPAEIVRSQLTRLAKTLYITCQYVDPSFTEDQRKARAAALQRAEAGAEKEHSETLERRGIIEKKKQAAATAAAQKDMEEARRKQQRTQQLEAAEEERRAAEMREREAKRMKEQQNRVQQEEVKKQLQELKQSVRLDFDLESLDINELDTQRVRALKIQALEKEKNQVAENLRKVGKRNDHLERAFRREEVKHLPADYEAQRKRDVAEYEETKKQTLQDSEEKHTEDVALKKRLSRLVDRYEEFRDRVRTERRAQFEKQRRNAEKELQQKKEQRIRDFRERKLKEQREKEARERAEREEEERIEREAEEKAAAEEERRRKLAEEKERRDAERRRLDEQAEKQRQREAEAEARIAAKRSGPTSERPERSERATAPEKTAESTGPPRVFGKSAGGWREREAARLAANKDNVSATQPPTSPGEDAPPPASGAGGGGSKFVPPHMRRNADGAGAGAADGWRARSRDENAGGKYQAPRRGGEQIDRGDSPANGTSGAEQAPAEVTAGASTGGKYRPGAFSRRNQGA